MEKEIIQTTEKKKEIVSKEPKKEKTTINKFSSFLKEVVALLFWTYVLLKLFVFDIDIWLINKYLPRYAWLLKFKLLFLIVFIAVIWLVTRNKHILSWSFYILFYPVIFFLWKIPTFVFKQKSWIFAFAFVNAVISFFKSVKHNFIMFTLFVVSSVTIFTSLNEKLLWIMILALFLVISIIYIRRFTLLFKPSSIFQIYKKIFSATKSYGAKQTTLFALDDDIKNLPIESLDKKQLEKRTTNLQTSVLFNRICFFAAKKLRDYQDSGFNVMSYILNVLLLIILTVFSFAVINFGLFKISDGFFSYSAVPKFFTFFYYSFNNLLFNSIKEIAPIMPISQIVLMIEQFFAFILVVIFISLLFSIRNQKHTEELNEAIKGIEAQGVEIEGFIKDEYKINSIEDAMVELKKMKAGLIKFIYKITENIK
ncbi:MAG: hypothetical protein ACKKMW_01530 [Candidatus Nealsonbacteria bacterium]